MISFVSAFYPVQGTGRALWIDLVNDDTWQHNGQVADTFFWGQSEPSPSSEVCTVMNLFGNWGDVGCTRVYPIVCEMENN